MKCPVCHHAESRVTETRLHKDGDIRRRRVCTSCRARFSTVESILTSFPHVVKKDGRREPFNKEKLRRGIQIACKKRPVSIGQIESMVSRIANWTQNRGEKELRSEQIGQRVVLELKRIDDVAYIRFASVYRTFKDVHEFVECLEDESSLHNEEMKV